MKMFGRAALALASALAVVACSSQNGLNPLVPNAVRHDVAFSPAAPPQPGRVRPACPSVPFGYARCFALVRTDLRYDRPPVYHASNGYYGPLGPEQLREAYNLPASSGGSGQTVGIVDAYDDPTAESDLAKYRKELGLTPCTTANGCFQKLNQDGKSSPLPKADAGWAGEISLDLDMASAVCPLCHIVLIETKNNKFQNLARGPKAAAAAGANVVSNSYGGAECVLHKGKVQCSSPLSMAKDYAIPNVIVTASSGDFTWFAGPQTPADFRTVVAVGGTSLYPFKNRRGWMETAWTGAGSGCSRFVKRPAWIPAGTGCPKNMRPISDVSAVADPYTGVLVYQTFPYSKGGFFVYGGTSVSSPIVAAVYALAGNASSQNYGAKLYTAGRASITDVLIGKNGIPGLINNAGQQCVPTSICASMPGWDGPTGVGTPWGVKAF